MQYSDYFTGLSNVAEAIMFDAQLVFDGIDQASGGVWNEDIKYAEADGSGALTNTSRTLPNDTTAYAYGIVPCDANGDIYYQINASGSLTMDCWIRIWGWWL